MTSDEVFGGPNQIAMLEYRRIKGIDIDEEYIYLTSR